MPEQAYTVTVAKDIEDLIPDFLRNRRQELETLRAAAASGDFERLRQLGHRMRGVGTPYGFDRVSEIGKRIEDGASAGDHSAIEAPIAEYAQYLSRVKIVCQ